MSVTAETELTPRQRCILALYAAGSSRSEISSLVFVSESRVRDDLKEAQESLGAHSLRQAVVLAFAHGILEPTKEGTVVTPSRRS